MKDGKARRSRTRSRTHCHLSHEEGVKALVTEFVTRIDTVGQQGLLSIVMARHTSQQEKCEAWTRLKSLNPDLSVLQVARRCNLKVIACEAGEMYRERKSAVSSPSHLQAAIA